MAVNHKQSITQIWHRRSREQLLIVYERVYVNVGNFGFIGLRLLFADMSAKGGGGGKSTFCQKKIEFFIIKELKKNIKELGK